MQTQLQASYRLISGENSLSLLNFLPAAAENIFVLFIFC